jgi:hypothetical protein
VTTIAPSPQLIVSTIAALASWVGLLVLLVRWTRPRRPRAGADPER